MTYVLEIVGELSTLFQFESNLLEITALKSSQIGTKYDDLMMMLMDVVCFNLKI